MHAFQWIRDRAHRGSRLAPATRCRRWISRWFWNFFFTLKNHRELHLRHLVVGASLDGLDLESIENYALKNNAFQSSVTVFLSKSWHVWPPRPNSVLVMDQWYIMSLHARNHHKWCLWCLMIILSRLAGFKPIIIDITGTSPDGDEHPIIYFTFQYFLMIFFKIGFESSQLAIPRNQSN